MIAISRREYKRLLSKPSESFYVIGRSNQAVTVIEHSENDDVDFIESRLPGGFEVIGFVNRSSFVRPIRLLNEKSFVVVDDENCEVVAEPICIGFVDIDFEFKIAGLEEICDEFGQKLADSGVVWAVDGEINAPVRPSKDFKDFVRFELIVPTSKKPVDALQHIRIQGRFLICAKPDLNSVREDLERNLCAKMSMISNELTLGRHKQHPLGFRVLRINPKDSPIPLRSEYYCRPTSISPITSPDIIVAEPGNIELASKLRFSSISPNLLKDSLPRSCWMLLAVIVFGLAVWIGAKSHFYQSFIN